jgi:hypothetical protein
MTSSVRHLTLLNYRISVHVCHPTVAQRARPDTWLTQAVEGTFCTILYPYEPIASTVIQRHGTDGASHWIQGD